MTKLWKNVAGAAILVGATTLVTSHVVSQDQGQSGEMPPAAERAMERMTAWMQYGEPGPEHEEMHNSAGTWHNTNAFWMYPGAEEMHSESVSRLRPVLGGRFMIEETAGVMEFMGEKHIVEGLGIFGYDRLHEKHFFIWLDNMSTIPMWGHGKVDESGNIVYHSKMPDPTSKGTMIEYKSVHEKTSNDHGTFTMYEKQPDGSWFKHMELNATRH